MIEVLYNPCVGHFLICRTSPDGDITYDRFTLATYMDIMPNEMSAFNDWVYGLYCIGEHHERLNG